MVEPLPTRGERLASTPARAYVARHDGAPYADRPTPKDTPPRDGPGMSLRDWFAGEVMAVMRGENPHASSAQVAEGAYEDADAMLAVRGRGGKKGGVTDG